MHELKGSEGMNPNTLIPFLKIFLFSSLDQFIVTLFFRYSVESP